MSKRSDIIDGKKAASERYGLVYTEVLGWIDLGHAQGTDIKDLLRKIAHGEFSKKRVLRCNLFAGHDVTRQPLQDRKGYNLAYQAWQTALGTAKHRFSYDDGNGAGL